MVLLPGCKCCGGGGPCWRCYQRSTLNSCDRYDFAFRVTVADFYADPSPPTGGDTSQVIFDTSEGTGIPVGAELLLNEPDWGTYCKWSLQYTAPEKSACIVDNEGNPIGFPGLDNASVRMTLDAGGQPDPDGNVPLQLAWQPQDTTTFGGKPSGEWPWPTKNDNCSVFAYDNGLGLVPDAPPITEPGEYIWRVPITYKSAVQPAPTLVGNIGFKVEVFSKDAISADGYEYQCFDAPPAEDGWIATGDCSATEAECAEECPPFPCQEPCSAPFQVAGYAAKDKLRQFIGDGGTTGEPYPYAPSITGWLNSTTNSIDAITNDAMSALMKSDVVQFGRSKSIRFSTKVIKKTNVQECQAAATRTIIDTPSITSLSSGQITIATQSLSSASDVSGTSAVISVSIDFSDLNNPTRIMRMQNISFGGLDFPIDSSLSNVTFIPKSWCSELFQPDGFRVFQLDQERWIDGPLKIDFYLADQSAPGISQRDYTNAWYWPDSFIQPYCEPCEDTPSGGRTMPTTKATTGPGTHLKNLLGWVGIRAKEKGCKCGHVQKKMDKGGPQWCRDHKEEILDHLEKEAKKRGLPFVRMAAGKLVDLAIRRAEKDSA